MVSYNSFQDTKQQLTEDSLEKIETDFAISIPPEIRSHYLRYNGGAPERCLFRGTNTTYDVRRFLPISATNDEWTFEDAWEALKIRERILPENLVAFAIDSFGNYFCFSVGAADRGAIYFFISEYASMDPDQAVTFLAESLPAFISGLEYSDK